MLSMPFCIGSSTRRHPAWQIMMAVAQARCADVASGSTMSVARAPAMPSDCVQCPTPMWGTMRRAWSPPRLRAGGEQPTGVHTQAQPKAALGARQPRSNVDWGRACACSHRQPYACTEQHAARVHKRWPRITAATGVGHLRLITPPVFMRASKAGNTVITSVLMMMAMGSTTVPPK